MVNNTTDGRPLSPPGTFQTYKSITIKADYENIHLCLYICMYIIYDSERVVAMLPSLTTIYSPKLTFLASFTSSLWSKFPCESI